MSTSQDFYLSDLEISTTATLATLSGAASTSFSGDATAELDVSASVLQALFQFHTDAIDVDNVVADDLKYKVVYDSSDTPLSADFLENTVVITGMIDGNATTNTVPFDYARYLAQCLFNTYLGVDLFENEEELRDDLNTSARAALNTKLLSFDTLGERTASDSSNPCKAILDQIINNKPDRLSTLHLVSGSSESTNEGADAWYYAPIIAGDALYFKLIVSADAGQAAIVDVSTVTTPDRTYLIKINAVGANAW